MKAKPSVSLRGIRTFCVAARRESFSLAADDLFITPSAVSHQIKSLEDELGQRLFDRNARDLRLTGPGRQLYAELNPLVEQMDGIVATFRDDRARGTVRMSVQPFFASEYFVPRLGEFTDEYPEVDIRVAASDESAESRPGDVDLSIRLYKRPPAGVESHKLMPLRLVAAGSRSLAESLTVEEGRIVSPFPIIIHESFPNIWKQWSKSAGIELPRNPKVTRLDSMIAAVRAVEQGIGAALVPVPVAEQWFRQQTIFRLFDDELIADVSYYLVWGDEALLRPGTGLLRDWILQRVTDAD
ncbi:MAG: LysR substrate-binding domain-containing protein [Pseudomonadota bacterium]